MYKGHLGSKSLSSLDGKTIAHLGICHKTIKKHIMIE